MTTTARVLLALHLLALLLGGAYLVLSLTVGATPDANIGAGLAALWLALLGVPWSLPLLTGDAGGTWFVLVAAGTALLNLALHLGVRVLVARRRRAS